MVGVLEGRGENEEEKIIFRKEDIRFIARTRNELIRQEKTKRKARENRAAMLVVGDIKRACCLSYGVTCRTIYSDR